MPFDFRNCNNVILSGEEAAELEERGWRSADLHVHTLFSYDVLPVPSLHPEALYRKARKMGMGYVTFTDHDTMRTHQVLGEREGLVTGVEIRIRDLEFAGHTVHVNVYDLNDEDFAELEEIAFVEGDLRAFVRCLHRRGLPFTYNHPFWFEPGERPNLRAIPEIVKLFPVVEYNMHRVTKKNQLAIAMARKYDKGLVAVTDSHSGMIGKVRTLSKGDSFREYFRNIAEGRSRIVASDLTMQDLIDEVNAWIELIFNLDLARLDISDFSTGFGHLDQLVRALASERLRRHTKVYRNLEKLTYRISNTGIPASLYLRMENSIMPQIEDFMMARLL
ncbi:MAG TPA: PHP domain-containing protein [Methanothrix sp.]|nr:PHP domain-containing protein [Methanothrix sp.]